MGAGILPTTIYKNKLYFLFGKENKFERSAPGYSDFGGGTDDKETYFETAIREAGEELTGFLGDSSDIRKLLSKSGTYNIDYKSESSHFNMYRVHIFPLQYDELLPYYYNNNQRFIQKKIPPKIIKSSKIFEKEEIRWFCIDELHKKRSQFRHYFRNIIDIILLQKRNIKHFIERTSKGIKHTKTKRPLTKTKRPLTKTKRPLTKTKRRR
jgi:8-oxo-dGTP pyrophosphatase MutT (NUDIX family)